MGEILFEGYTDEDEDKFNEFYQQWLRTGDKDVERGRIEKALDN